MEITIEYQPILEAPAALERDQAPAASGVKSIKNNELCKTKPISKPNPWLIPNTRVPAGNVNFCRILSIF
jgi:hypothetical protein